MSSPSTWRVRDLASCFYACRVPLEEEPDIFCSKQPQMLKESMVLGSKTDLRGSGKVPFDVKKVYNEDRGEPFPRDSSHNNRRKGGRAEEATRREGPSFAEEDYIVFCFREDGGIHIISEGNSSSSSGHHENDQHANTASIMTRKDDEGGAEWPPDDETKDINHVGQPNASKIEPFESFDSNSSDTSRRSSFAFPELGTEWTGSPVHLPTSEAAPSHVHQHSCRCCLEFSS